MMNNLYFMSYICAFDNDWTNFSLTYFSFLILKRVTCSHLSLGRRSPSLCFQSLSLSFIRANTHTCACTDMYACTHTLI